MSLFDPGAFDDFFGRGGNRLPNGKRKSSKSGYCEHCHGRHSVDFVHDIIAPVVGVAVLGFTLSSFAGLLNRN